MRTERRHHPLYARLDGEKVEKCPFYLKVLARQYRIHISDVTAQRRRRAAGI